MRITVLAENVRGRENVRAEHGLSLYIETEKHNILFDTGASGLFAENARVLGKDIKKVDAAVISHGHYDHGGGISRFLELNGSAPVYISSYAFSEIYRLSAEGEKYIGINRSLAENSRIVKLDKGMDIDDEISVFAGVSGRKLWPSGNKKMRIKINGELIEDDFSHEQNLVVNSGKRVLFAGCSHNGAVNILEEYIKIYGKAPDAFVGGFHFRRDGEYTEDDIAVMKKTAEYFKEVPTDFYTCHCTGIEPYKLMKDIMGSRLNYLRCGDTAEL